MRTTRKELDQLAEMLSSLIGGQPFYINVAYGSPRLMRECGESGGECEASPRLLSGQLAEVIRSMLRGTNLYKWEGKPSAKE